MKPFSETSIFDSTKDPFFTTGFTGGGENPNTFAGSLRNKEQIKISFNVKNPVKMLANTSSIYYFNVTEQQWNIPTASIPDHVGPFQRFSFKTTDIPTYNPGSGITYPAGVTKGSYFIEDAKGFNAYGRSITSGNLDIYRRIDPTLSNFYWSQTIDIAGSWAENDQILNAMTDDYVKSIQRSQIYDATRDEVFDIKITRPFLIEKAVIEIPMCMGPTWFQDRTTACLGYATGSYAGTVTTSGIEYIDVGGPAITFSLFCQKKYGQNNIRDLILTGVVTHADDAKINNVRKSPSYVGTETYIIENSGLLDPTFIVEKNQSSFYTGSVIFKSTACISNGSNRILHMQAFMLKDGASGYFQSSSMEQEFANVYASQRISFPEFANKMQIGSTGFRIASIDPFGRGGTGFSPSGGSIFGGEYTTPQIHNSEILNPFYVDQIGNLTKSIGDLSSSINAAAASYTPPLPSVLGIYELLTGDVSDFYSIRESPYLLNPGDKLVISLSKTRPATKSAVFDIPDTSSALVGKGNMLNYVPRFGSSAGHDVTLSTGSINVTLYGSYVRQGSRYTP